MNKVNYALAMALIALSANAQSKLDAGSRMALDYFKQAQTGEKSLVAPVNMPFEINTMSRAESTTSMFVSLNQGADLSKIEALGFNVITITGNIVLVNGPINAVEQLAALEEVKAISFGEKYKTKLDQARSSIGVDVIHSGGENLPQAYTGAGVVTGLFDTGMDPNHPNFSDANGNSRVKKIWRYAGTNGQAVEYSVESFTTDTRSETHGTHTLGCMAGAFNKKGGKVAQVANSGNSVNVRTTVANPFYGMAKESDIAISCGELNSANIISGISNIIDYAESEGKPVVVNLSLGSNTGPHDGKDLYSQSVSALTKKGIICMAAGNEGEDNISVVKNFTASDNTLKTFLTTSSSSMSGILDIWGDDSEDFTVSIVIYNLNTGSVEYSYDISTSKEETIYLTSSSYTASEYIHSSSFDSAFSNSYLIIGSSKNTDVNNRREVLMNYTLAFNSSTNSDHSRVIGFIITGKAGHRVDMTTDTDYASFTGLGQEGWIDGTPDFSISSMAAAEGMISVGSFNTRSNWPTLAKVLYGYYNSNGVAPGYALNELSGFSSYATLVDGRTLPTVVAPGAGIISSISSYYTDSQYSSDDLNTCSATYTKNGRDYYWENEQGTSMACPVAAGTIALWLQADPTLTYEDVVKVIKATAVNDDATAANPIKAGAGKINALAGLQYILGLSSVKGIAVNSADKMLITSAGQNAWQVYVPGATIVNAALYNTSGQLAAKVSANSETAVISADNLAKGIYILNANGKSQRVIVK